jgi:hypothetical protein
LPKLADPVNIPRAGLTARDRGARGGRAPVASLQL